MAAGNNAQSVGEQFTECGLQVVPGKSRAQKSPHRCGLFLVDQLIN
jgi:hypothetical protein